MVGPPRKGLVFLLIVVVVVQASLLDGPSGREIGTIISLMASDCNFSSFCQEVHRGGLHVSPTGHRRPVIVPNVGRSPMSTFLRSLLLRLGLVAVNRCATHAGISCLMSAPIFRSLPGTRRMETDCLASFLYAGGYE